MILWFFSNKKKFLYRQSNLVEFSKRRIHLKIQNQINQMGIVMHKLIQIGEYCDCLQDWKKYEIEETQSQSNLFMSQNESNLEDPIDKVFEDQKIESGLDKQLQLMQQRLRKRKKLKAEYIKQKQKQMKAKQLEEERKDRQRRQKIQKQKELWLRQQQLKKFKELQAEKVRRENQQKKVRALKRNKRLKEKNLSRHDLLKVQIQNNTFSTADQNAQKEPTHEAENVPEQKQSGNQKQQKKQVTEKAVKEKVQKSKKATKPKKKGRKQSSNSSSSSCSSQTQSQQSKYKNVFQQPQYYHQQQRYIPQKDQLHYHQPQPSDLDSALFSHRKQYQKPQIQIIDLEKLNQHKLRQQVTQLVIKKLKDRLDSQPHSQTVPLHPAIHSHRVSANTKGYDQRRNHQQLRLMGNRDQQGYCQEVEFVDAPMHSTILEKESNDYFLDQNDREEYLKEMFR